MIDATQSKLNQSQESEHHLKILEILDESDITPKQYFFWFVASGGTMLDGISVMIAGISLHLLSVKLTSLMMGLIGTALVLGAVIGSNIGGNLADKLGRKKLFAINMFVIIIGALMAMFSFSNWILLASQLIIGLGIGSDFAVSGAYVAEMLPRKNRSRLMVGTITFQAVGLIIAGLLSMLLIDIVTSTDVWRYLFGVQIIVAAGYFTARLFMYESPRWLMSQGENVKAVKLISYLYPNRDKELQQLGSSVGSQKHIVTLPMSKPATASYSVLFSKEYKKRTILVSLPWFLMDIATYGIGLFTPIVLASIDMQSKEIAKRTAEIHNILGSTAVDLFLLIGFFIALWFVPKFGKLFMQKMGFVGMAVGMIMLFLSTLLHLSDMWHLVMIFVGFIIFNLFMNAGPNATTFAMAPDLFPTQLRSTASGFAAGFAKIGAMLGIFFIPIIKEHYSISVVLAGMAAVSLLGLAITIIYGEEIDEKVTLESRHRQIFKKQVGID